MSIEKEIMVSQGESIWSYSKRIREERFIKVAEALGINHRQGSISDIDFCEAVVNRLTELESRVAEIEKLHHEK